MNAPTEDCGENCRKTAVIASSDLAVKRVLSPALNSRRNEHDFARHIAYNAFPEHKLQTTLFGAQHRIAPKSLSIKNQLRIAC